jgi:tRNA-2-methylthio-N6-dimethylallyladenosine synthase
MTDKATTEVNGKMVAGIQARHRSVFVETYGCQMNEYDSEIVREILRRNDFTLADSIDSAGVVLLNTCAIRENAHDKIRSRIGELRQLKKRNKGMILGVLGCMAQNLKKELLEDNASVDLIAGPDSYKALPVMIDRVHNTGEREFKLTLSEYETYADVFPTNRHGTNAWIAVMRGCDNYCTFCVVPMTRGRERSRDPFNVIEEVKQLADHGFKQVTLLGQNVNSYKFKGFDFAKLITAVSRIEGIERIRFTSPHPKDFPESLLEVVATNPKACKHIHLPLQAGCNRVLDAMNRTYTREYFVELAHRMREQISGLVLTTDVIVGFPTETETEFQESLDVMQEVQFDSAFMFKYSERKETMASRTMPDDISDEIKTNRIMRLIDQQRHISYHRNQSHLGGTFNVMVEGYGKKPKQLLGRNDGNKIVVFPDTGAKPGDFVDVRIEEVTPNTLIGVSV